jgi:hypothetical protein
MCYSCIHDFLRTTTKVESNGIALPHPVEETSISKFEPFSLFWNTEGNPRVAGIYKLCGPAAKHARSPAAAFRRHRGLAGQSQCAGCGDVQPAAAPVTPVMLMWSWAGLTPEAKKCIPTVFFLLLPVCRRQNAHVLPNNFLCVNIVCLDVHPGFISNFFDILKYI